MVKRNKTNKLIGSKQLLCKKIILQKGDPLIFNTYSKCYSEEQEYFLNIGLRLFQRDLKHLIEDHLFLSNSLC